jgi:hypothetical protein
VKLSWIYIHEPVWCLVLGSLGVEISRIQRADHTVSGGVSILYAFQPFVKDNALLDSADRLVCAD